MTHPDILIVGAGVAGLSLATALGREGFRVTVIDGAKRPSATHCR
jgi:2-polyprenyl-6-methoxyphenol hydroxylase-like FAD-dependent oxidoreductase